MGFVREWGEVPSPHAPGTVQSRHASGITVEPRPLSPIVMLTVARMFALVFALMFNFACTFYGEHPARVLSDATGGEGLSASSGRMCKQETGPKWSALWLRTMWA